ncbi:GntR family transcriptional regulator [Brumimicrobium salinarum]|uniref:GntR family transcriptional regulator n=1 Tax=Brumimicrobium salinarum TaxID=2058658 RepID=A0A2I0R2G8_9FLAO|nr:PLP-dependent aminotransferase family protein [Brumimicrobium salinarum]PKR80778.1 GntR family transcriptional regulator [Brumimicrobium salinarum]
MISISQYIRIDRRKSDPLYLQITYQYINAVQGGLLLEGTKLPGTRVWSNELGVHRKTVIAAFEELAAQNWMRIQAKVGAFVQNPTVKAQKSQAKAAKSVDSIQQSGFEFQRSFLLSSPYEHENHRLICNEGQPDYRILKTQELSRFYSGALKRRNIQQHIGNYAVQENDFFKEQLSFYLNLSRGFHIDKSHLLTAKSKETLFYTLAKTLFKPKDVVLIGELNLFSMNMVFNQANISLKTVPVDEHGMDIAYIEKSYNKGEIKGVYLNPSQGYPTTFPLFNSRKEKLKALAVKYDFVIIEDHEDFDFSHQKSVELPSSIQEAKGRIIHLGTIGKHLHPSFQMSFIVAFPDFIAAAKKHVSVLQPQGNYVLEQALGEMISEGDFYRYLKKSMKIYTERLQFFEDLLRTHLGNEIEYEIPNNGFAFWIIFKQSISLVALSKELKKRDVFLPRICMYQNHQLTALRLGFAHWNKEEMEEVVKELGGMVNKV